MSEFNDRMESQRKVLNIVNKFIIKKEELFGLSENTLIRWSHANGITEDSEVMNILRRIASKLFFLATKSQEQVTKEYKNISSAVDLLVGDLKKVVG